MESHKQHFTHNNTFEFLNRSITNKEQAWITKEGQQIQLETMPIRDLHSLLSRIVRYKIIFKQYSQRGYWISRIYRELNKRHYIENQNKKTEKVLSLHSFL